MFACDHAEISPDIVCLSKGLTGGYLPMAIAATTDEIYNAFYADYSEGKAFMHSHTYCGNPLACSAAVEVLNILEEEQILEKAKINAEYFKALVNDTFAKNRNIGETRSLGLINAIEIVSDKENKLSFDSKKRVGYQIYKEALKIGVILRPLGDIIYFNPPLIIEKNDMDFAVDVCSKAMRNVLG